jgi:hypothetical protein
VAAAAQPDALRHQQPGAVPLQPPDHTRGDCEAAPDAVVALAPEGTMLAEAASKNRPDEQQRTADQNTAEEALDTSAAADAVPAAGLQHSDKAAEPLRSVPDSLTKVLQGASFEASPLGTDRVDASQQPQQERPAQTIETPSDAWDRKRRRLSRRYSRAAKQWRKLTSRQPQQQPGAQPAPTFRTAPLAGIPADQSATAGPPSSQQAADRTQPAAGQPSVMPSHAESQRQVHTSTAASQPPQQQLAQDASGVEPAQPRATAAAISRQGAEAPAGWGVPQHAALPAGNQTHDAAAEAAATAARQHHALQRAEELRVTDTLQPPPPVHESLSRTSSGRIKVTTTSNPNHTPRSPPRTHYCTMSPKSFEALIFPPPKRTY